MSIAKGEVKVSVDKIVNLEKEITAKDQAIGAQQEQNRNLTIQLGEQKLSHEKEVKELTEKLGKEVRIIESKGKTKNTRTCPSCGYKSNTTNSYCYECDYNLRGIPFDSEPKVLEYKGLDDVVDMIRKEESKKLKTDVNKLEDEKETLTYMLEKSSKEIDRLKVQKDEEVKDAKSRTRDRYNKLLSEQEKRYNELEEEKTEIITGLEKEIQKIQDDKTDKQIEEARKQEIIDLKVAVEEYKKDKEDVLNMLPKFLRKRFENKKAEENALIKVTEREDLVETISNNYPKVKRRSKAWGHIIKSKFDGIKLSRWISINATKGGDNYYTSPW